MILNRLSRSISVAVMSIALISLSTSATAQMAVFDPTNYAQNVLQAAHALEQVNNQIKSLQNEAVMLQNMAKNLKHLDFSSLAAINGDLARVNGLIAQAKGIATTLAQTQAVIATQFPGAYSKAVTTNALVSDAEARWQSTMGSYQQTLLVQAQIDENLQTDAGTLNQLLAASEGADGSLAAQQASNQLIALSTKQQMQIQALMAAQFRAQAVNDARKVEAEAAGRAATAKFVGPATAYTPQ